MLLDAEQKKELAQYILEQENFPEFLRDSYHASPQIIKNVLTEIQEGELYLCLEQAGGDQGVSGIRTPWPYSPQKVGAWPSGGHYAEYFTYREGA